MKQKESDFLKFINRHFHVIIYSAYFFILMFFFYKAKLHSLFPFPLQGSEEYSLLKAVKEIQNGSYRPVDYNFSPFYVLFLSFLGYCSYGNLIIMRIIQAAFCSFIPVYVYKLARRLRLGRENAQIAAFLYCLYGAAAMVSLGFSSNAMISLFFLLFVYFLIKAFLSKKWYNYSLTGFFGAYALLFGGIYFLLIIIVFPLFLLLFAKIRERFHLKNMIILCLAFTAIVIPVSLYTLFSFGTFSLIYQNASPVEAYSWGPLISSYEIPLNISLYTYADVVDFMKIFIVPFNFLVIMSLLSFTIRRRAGGLFFVGIFIAVYSVFVLYLHNFYCYRAPIVPFMCVLAGGTIFGIRNEKSKFKIVLIFLSVALFTTLTYNDPALMRSDNEKRSVADILIKAGRYEKATAYLDKIETNGIPATAQWVELIKSICRSGDVKWSLEVEYLFLKHLKKRSNRHLIIPINPNSNK